MQVCGLCGELVFALFVTASDNLKRFPNTLLRLTLSSASKMHQRVSAPERESVLRPEIVCQTSTSICSPSIRFHTIAESSDLSELTVLRPTSFGDLAKA